MRPDEIADFAETLARISASGGGPKALVAHLARVTRGGVLLEDAQWQNKGWLSLLATHSNGEADELVRLTAAAIGIELARDVAGAPATKAAFWSALISDSFVDAASAREEAAARGIALAPQYCIVMLEAETPSSLSPAAVSAELRALATSAFRASGSELGLCEREQSLLVFVPAAREVDASNAKTAAGLLPRTAARRKSELRISGGVGTLESIAAASRAAATAHAALVIGRRIYGSGRVAAYDELGAYPLLYEGADTARLRAFASSVLAPLRQYDEKHQTELERTLRLYFAVGQNIKTASERLSVHRHTVFYRLRQIGEITSRTLESPHDQLTFRLALAIDELHA